MKNLATSNRSAIFKPAPIKVRQNRNIQLTFYNSISILYVEDNIMNQELARKVFERLGCRLYIANDGYEALEMITREKYDMIFMDIDMPRINGYEATQIIRQTLCLNTPIIALTNRDSETDMNQCHIVGMNGHMGKPLNVVELEHTIYRWNRRN
jgi:CheY-like chemotaxis protein